jgi:hypothetical protein
MMEKNKNSVRAKNPSWSVRAALEAGRHREVVERVVAPGRNGEEAMALISALSFLGRIEEAEELWGIAGKRLNGPERALARFSLALAAMRVSRFRFARRFLEGNQEDPETRESAESAQGMGLYFYYLGRFPRALRLARRARKRAAAAGNRYLLAFATDLVGHSLVQTGHRSAGIRLLSVASRTAGRAEGADPFTIERLIYEAEAGLRPDSILDELEREFSREAENSYSRSNLALELARQLTLRGHWHQARLLLDREAPAIYAFENRRQEATLQLRLAELCVRQGDGPGALHFLRAARRCLLRIADKIYELRILGLEHKVLRQLEKREPSVASLARFSELSAAYSHPMNRRIACRSRGGVSAEELPGEDPLGDLLDSCAARPAAAAQQILSTAYLGLWPEAAGLAPGRRALVLFASGSWVAVNSSGVWRSRAALSAQSAALLRRLGQGVAGKEELVRELWKYDYHPLRHDPLIYAALAALRKALGEAANWLETRDNGWYFPCLVLEGHASPELPLARPAAQFVEFNPDPDLNWRQSRALATFPQDGVWTIARYREQFGLSTMTAWRDLDGLRKKRYLLRIGHGRATAYRKGEHI